MTTVAEKLAAEAPARTRRDIERRAIVDLQLQEQKQCKPLVCHGDSPVRQLAAWANYEPDLEKRDCEHCLHGARGGRGDWFCTSLHKDDCAGTTEHPLWSCRYVWMNEADLLHRATAVCPDCCLAFERLTGMERQGLLFCRRCAAMRCSYCGECGCEGDCDAARAAIAEREL